MDSQELGPNIDSYERERNALGERISRKLSEFTAVADNRVQPLLSELRKILSDLSGSLTGEDYNRAKSRAEEILIQLGEPMGQ